MEEPNFLYQNSKPKWPGMTCLSEDSIAEYTIVSAGTADSLFYIRDENNVFFNAQGFLAGKDVYKRQEVYSLTPARCWKVKRRCHRKGSIELKPQ